MIYLCKQNVLYFIQYYNHAIIHNIRDNDIDVDGQEVDCLMFSRYLQK
jgi:hypothetical protein